MTGLLEPGSWLPPPLPDCGAEPEFCEAEQIRRIANGECRTMTDKSPLVVHGMHGMGDNIHQRAILRELMKAHSVWLDTSWACIYHDLIAEGLRVVRKPVALRTQIKNAEREKHLFVHGPAPHHPLAARRVSYNTQQVRQAPSNTILEAMFRAAGIPDAYKDADFTLPVPESWCDDKVKPIIDAARDKPILIYRPLVARPEWRGSMVRNANEQDYAELVAVIRDSFFVVSVADLLPTREWIVGPLLKADMTLHNGELHFEQLAALVHHAKLMFTSAGFGSVLAPAVRTPCISITGGYEPGCWHADGAKFAPYLFIDPIKVCWCGTSACTNPCQKKIDLGPARARIIEFVSQRLGISPAVEKRPMAEMFDPTNIDSFNNPPPPPRRPSYPHHRHPALQFPARPRPQGGGGVRA